MTLLSRTEFKLAVWNRDNGKCVVCKKDAVDAHHIIERKLFSAPEEFGGYFLDNGVSVCSECHLDCENTSISASDLRKKAKIKNVVLPSHFDPEEDYDKWGNIILPHSLYRLQGELFHDEACQKALKPWIHLFKPYTKYPRTLHLPWSEGVHDDDRIHSGTEQWIGKEIVVTMKMDGEGTTMYHNHIHARSIDSKNHPSRTWVKNFWSYFASDIPEGWRICGENLYAKHSIHYVDLPSYFLGFNIWDKRNNCLGWYETLEFFNLLAIQTPKVLYCGIYDENIIRNIKINPTLEEGYVLRTIDGFSYRDFRKYVGKYVRKNHVKTSKFWLNQPIVKNKLKE